MLLAPLELREIDETNWRPIARLSRTLSDQQQKFVAHNAYSILEAMYEPNLFPRGIYDGETPIGFVMWGKSEKREYEIIRLMIGGAFQGKGYGRRVMQQVIDLLKAQPDCDTIYISFAPENDAARYLYASLGFEDTGRIVYDEVLFMMRVKEGKRA